MKKYKLHHKEDVYGGIHRIAVPGGWLYVTVGYRSHVHTTFVPDPSMEIEG